MFAQINKCSRDLFIFSMSDRKESSNIIKLVSFNPKDKVKIQNNDFVQCSV